MRAVFLLTALIAGASGGGCGGVTQAPEVQATVARVGQSAAAIRPAVRIAAVRNLTGRPECDALGQYLHLKAAALLEDTHGADVITDDLLAAADLASLNLQSVTSGAADYELQIDVVSAVERAGATVKLAVFSTQQQHATAEVRVVCRDLRAGSERSASAQGENGKGAWGALAQVNRATLLKREGFWALDQSLLGGAAARALASALPRALPAAP